MPTSIRWQVPGPLSAEEAGSRGICTASASSTSFSATIRQELFDEAFQAELAAVYQPRGTAPVPPALLAMVLAAPGLRPGRAMRKRW